MHNGENYYQLRLEYPIFTTTTANCIAKLPLF